MPKEQILASDIVSQHKERMLNLKKYYPFFRLSETSFSWFMDGKYDDILDMGYILMAVLRFFIEENNFRERDVTYRMYYEFITSFIRGFGINLNEEDNKVLADYIFEKIKNDGRPFSFEYYDPVERVRKISRVRLIESTIKDGTVWYSISPDGIEFYLDTKEVRDESRISVEQLLLEKMIRSNDFEGGVSVVKRINTEVERLWNQRNKVREALSDDLFAGVDEYENFFDTGIRWFGEEQKLFRKNMELIRTACDRAGFGAGAVTGQSMRQIYKLDTELKMAMNNHSRLLRACTELGNEVDEAVKRAKLSRLRSRFDFRSALKSMMENDRTDMLEFAVKPFLMPNTHKTFNLRKINDILNLRIPEKEETEKNTGETETEIVFQDELDDERFAANARTLFRVLFEMIKACGKFRLSQYNEAVRNIFGGETDRNGDYYAFLVHLCGQGTYDAGHASEDESFIGKIMHDFVNEDGNESFRNIRFAISFPDDTEETDMGDGRTITDAVIERIYDGEQKS